MPRTVACIALVAAVLPACGFEADYRGGTYTCTDGVCPSGLTCDDDQVCRVPGADDAGPDADTDAAPLDAAPALACADPGEITRGAPQHVEGDTTGSLDHVASLCGGMVHSSVDHVYRATAVAGDSLDVAIGGDPDGRAYVVTDCDGSPSTPSCLGNATAQPGDPIALTSLPAGDVFIVVDSAAVALSGPYTLDVHLRAP
jgi:hypothetical protein